MNPDTTIRPWLEACGSQFGNYRAYEYLRPDTSTRLEDPYFTYEILGLSPTQDGRQDLTTATGHTAHVSAYKTHLLRVRVDLYYSENGLKELAACALMAQDNDSIKAIFKGQGAFVEILGEVENDTTYDGERKHYHHHMFCTFNTNVQYTLDDINGVVDDVTVSIIVNDPPS